jgi:Putative Actinobacterial Holin-X, holin superfamily III
MATDLHSTHEPSVTGLVTGIINDAQTLFKQQFEMLKHEVKEDFRKTREASLMLGIGAGIGAVGAMLVAHMLALATFALFAPHLPLWACYGIWGAVTLAVGVGLVLAGKTKLDTVRPLDDEVAQTVKENVEWITKPK